MKSPSTSDRPDPGLVDGDQAALAELYRRYDERLHATAYRVTGDEAHAQDAVHDVFVGLDRAVRSYDERGDLLRWLRKVTVRTALMGMRSRRRRTRREETVGGRTRADPDPVEERLVVRKVLGRMPENRKRTARHLAECTRCQDRLRFIREFRGRIRETTRVQPSPARWVTVDGEPRWIMEDGRARRIAPGAGAPDVDVRVDREEG